MDLLLLFKHPVILIKESMSKSCKNKGNIQYTAVLKGTLLCLFVDICHSINLHSYTESASIEVHVYGCISDLTVPAFLFIETNCVCQHDQDGH